MMKYSVPVHGFRGGEIFDIVKRQITRAFVRTAARLFGADAVLVFCLRASAAKRHPHPRDLDLRSKLVFSKMTASMPLFVRVRNHPEEHTLPRRGYR